MHDAPPYGHSPIVDLQLVIGHEHLPLAQVGIDFLKLRQPRDIPPQTQARIIMTIDGRSSSRDVLLVEGARADAEFTWFQ